MAFTVESGSGDSGSNAYVSVADVDTHHGDRGNTRWADFTTPEKQFVIVRATDYIDKRFGKRFRGQRKTKQQALEWPRLDAFDDDGFALSGIDNLPRSLIKACAEYALRAGICGVLSPDPLLPVPKQSMESGVSCDDRNTTVVTGEVKRKKEKVGPLEEDTWFETASQVIGKNLGAGAKGIQSGLVNDFVIPEYPEADFWIEELIQSSMSTTLARA